MPGETLDHQGCSTPNDTRTSKTPPQRTAKRRRVGDRAGAREERVAYKRQRVRDLIDSGYSKADLKERRERYLCMREHPGRYCSECNPRRDPEPDEDDDGGDVELSEEEAELSSAWSDGTSGSDWDRPSPRYSDLWDEEQEADEVAEYIKERIQHETTVQKALETSCDDRTPHRTPVGGLYGHWELYNLEICPKLRWPTGEYFRLEFGKEAADREVPTMTKSDWMNGRCFITWHLKDNNGDITPFQISEHASLEPISIFLSEDEPADITFFGSNCLRLVVPRSAVYTDEATGDPEKEPKLEFAGIRRTEEEIAKRKQDRLDAERSRIAQERSDTVAGSMRGWNDD